MKVRVKRNYRDRDTLKLMRVGDEENYAHARAKELLGWGFVELLEAVEEEDLPAAESVIVSTEIRGSDLVVLMSKTDQEEKGAHKKYEDIEESEKAEIEPVAEKQEFTPFPEKSEGKKRGRKPKK
jgi:hypothetical protein